MIVNREMSAEIEFLRWLAVLVIALIMVLAIASQMADQKAGWLGTSTGDVATIERVIGGP